MSPDRTLTSGNGAKNWAHKQAQKRDLVKYFNPGEQIEVFIETPPERNGGEEAVATVSRDDARDGRVFISPGPHNLPRGAQVRCRITHVEQNYLKALAMWRID